MPTRTSVLTPGVKDKGLQRSSFCHGLRARQLTPNTQVTLTLTLTPQRELSQLPTVTPVIVILLIIITKLRGGGVTLTLPSPRYDQASACYRKKLPQLPTVIPVIVLLIII